MTIDISAVRKCLKSFDFKNLFREYLGWDNLDSDLNITVNDISFTLTAIAHKRGFAVYVCPSIPDKHTCMKIDRQVTKSAREHFIIYINEVAGEQMWQWVRRESGKSITSREQRFNISQSGDFLIQQLNQISISIDEEKDLTLTDVTGRVRPVFDVDKITKKFYDEFEIKHAQFMSHIEGFPPPEIINGKEKPNPDLQWYTSLTLNRLMFVYFIQKKGFLDKHPDYLRDRLTKVQSAHGVDHFQTFYDYFLIQLFHEGLGKYENKRRFNQKMKQLIGDIPHLNGGFFEEHDLEKQYSDIDIPDDAFKEIFDFFDNWQWHLDDRPLRSGNEINPDVIGYIFEKYVNQKQMGAYYTKEDVTRYISEYTILPFVLNAACKRCAVAFKPDGAMWQLLRDNPDRYLYPAMRKGVISSDGSIIPPPETLEAGIEDMSQRDEWNHPAEDIYGLPAETWREYIDRRQRCLEIRNRLSAGEVHDINDLVTLNLNILQFVRDAIINAEGPDLLRAFWHTLAGRVPEKSNENIELGITVLDPACGSGAFLFAALRILETLYRDCLARMKKFIEDAEHAAPRKPEEEINALIEAGERDIIEFKSSARWDIKENFYNPVLEESVMKTVAGFMNAYGGTLLIGVTDNGVPVGLKQDYLHTKKNNPTRDQFELWLTKYLMNRLGRHAKLYFHIDFATCNNEDVCRIRVYRSPKPVFVEKSDEETLYVRQGNATNPFTKSSDILKYRDQHWPPDQSIPQPPSPVDLAESTRTSEQAKRAYSDFRKIMARIKEHSNARYFILKSIIIHNLYGVDIMEEAVEICKLRLFLTLAARVEPGEKIEPLPDIDFNIRTGNALVGFASLEQVRQSMDMVNLPELPKIEEDATEIDHLFQQFRVQQSIHGGVITSQDKQELRNRLSQLDHKLDHYLANTYGIDVKEKLEFNKWKDSHQPLHWLVEFYGIMHSGGFNVVIGNPPYVNMSTIRKMYKLKNLTTEACPDIYAPCVERSLSILSSIGRFGMILPISFQFSKDFKMARQVSKDSLSEVWLSTFSRNPAALFSAGLGVRSTICIGRKDLSSTAIIRSTKLNRWIEEFRSFLFESLEFTRIPSNLEHLGWIRLDGIRMAQLFDVLISKRWSIGSDTGRGDHQVRYKAIALYYLSVFANDPPRYDRFGRSVEQTAIGAIEFSDPEIRDIVLVLLLSKITLLWWAATGDDFNVTTSTLLNTPLSTRALSPDLLEQYKCLSEQIQSKMQENIIYTKYAGDWMGNYDIKCVRDLTDKADRLLLESLGLGEYWEDVELAYAHFMKMTGERPGTVRKLPNFIARSDEGEGK